MDKKQGFTLIELVIVIVILGIISAVAVPKFANLSSDARIATLEGIQGAVNSSSVLIHLKAQVEGVSDGSIDLNDETVNIDNGYLSGSWGLSWAHVLDVGQDISFTSSEETCTKNAICGVGNQTEIDELPSGVADGITRGLALFWLEGDKLSDRCFVYYYNPGADASGDTSKEQPSIGIVSDGC